MAKLRACVFVISSLLITFVLPAPQASKLPSPSSLSFQLHLQPPAPLNRLHTSNSSFTQPLIPYLFSDQPLFRFDESSQAQIAVGVACGLYLADPAASTAMELPHIFLSTVSLQRNQAGRITSAVEEREDEGALVLMGSLASGAVSVVGGTHDFAFAMGQAKVSMAPAGGGSDTLVISFDVDLIYEQNEPQDPIEAL